MVVMPDGPQQRIILYARQWVKTLQRSRLPSFALVSHGGCERHFPDKTGPQQNWNASYLPLGRAMVFFP